MATHITTLRRQLAGTYTGAAVDAAPTTASEGVDLGAASRFLHVVAQTSGTAGAVSFQVWHYIAAAGVWVLDTGLGVAGTITIAAVTTPAEHLVIECPGDRVDIFTTVNAAGTTLTVNFVTANETE